MHLPVTTLTDFVPFRKQSATKHEPFQPGVVEYSKAGFELSHAVQFNTGPVLTAP